MNGNGFEGIIKESWGIWILFFIGDFMGDGDEVKKFMLEVLSEDFVFLVIFELKLIEEGVGLFIEKI